MFAKALDQFRIVGTDVPVKCVPQKNMPSAVCLFHAAERCARNQKLGTRCCSGHGTTDNCFVFLEFGELIGDPGDIELLKDVGVIVYGERVQNACNK